MGLFKQMKDMKKTVEAAPDMIAQAQQMQAQALELQAAQQAAAQAQMQQAAQATDAAAAAGGAEFEPIAGVSIELYAEISKGLAAFGYDQSKAVEIAQSKGVTADNWQLALDGWNDRMKSHPAVAQKFNKLYTGR